MKPLAALALSCFLAPAVLFAQTPPQQDHADGHAGMQVDKAPVPPSKSLIVTFQGANTTLTLEDLLKLPQVTVHVHNAHLNQDETYSGPLVSDILARAGLSSSKENEPLILHSAVVATGTDHYFVLYSAAEMEPSFSTGKVIVAIMKGDLPNTDGGNIELINTDATKPARWVHGLSVLSVVSMAPNK
jgi:hypothetical protein